ncbi:MAG: class II fructose-bisphosphate aldolase [Bryobacteraceae bacterium]
MLQTMLEGKAKKRLDVERIREIKKATRCFLTLHGGSGTKDSDLQDAVASGINIVHINTEL